MPSAGNKGNPAHKRAANARRIARRAASWKRGKDRAELNRLAQREREIANTRTGITPWEQACRERAVRRAPLADAWRLGQRKKAPVPERSQVVVERR